MALGARTPKLLQRVRDAAVPQMVITPFVDCPDQIVISNANADTLALLANRAGLLFQDSAPLAMLTSLPPIDHPTLPPRNGIADRLRMDSRAILDVYGPLA